MNRSTHFGIENHLGDSLTIAQIHKYDPTVIAPTIDPPHQHHLPTDIVRPKFTAGVGPPHIFQLI
jgi:hypothetical protein